MEIFSFWQSQLNSFSFCKCFSHSQLNLHWVFSFYTKHKHETTIVNTCKKINEEKNMNSKNQKKKKTKKNENVNTTVYTLYIKRVRKNQKKHYGEFVFLVHIQNPSVWVCYVYVCTFFHSLVVFFFFFLLFKLCSALIRVWCCFCKLRLLVICYCCWEMCHILAICVKLSSCTHGIGSKQQLKHNTEQNRRKNASVYVPFYWHLCENGPHLLCIAWNLYIEVVFLHTGCLKC